MTTKEKEKKIEFNNTQKNTRKLLDEKNKLKADNTKKDYEINSLKEEKRKSKYDEIIDENNKLKKELNEIKIELEKLKKENERQNNLIIEKEKKLKEVNELNKSLIKQKNELRDKLNQKENQIKECMQMQNKNIIDKEENQKIKLENNELINTMDFVDKYFLNRINSINNNNQNINFNFKENNEKYSKLDVGNYSNIFPYQIPNLKEIEENDKKLRYLNIVLTCLSQILSQYFLKEKNINRIKNNNQMQLSNEFLTYVQNSGNKNINENNSYSILMIIENIDKNLKYNYYLKNIISIIFDQLHKELKKEKEPININGSFFENNREKDDFNTSFRKFIKETSIISDNFSGFMEKKIQCIYSNINKSTYKFSIYNYLIFEIQKYKNKFNITNKEIDLNECFKYYRKDRSFREEEKSECEICNEMCQKNFISDYFSNPNFLILILVKGYKDSNEDIKVKFGEKLILKSKISEDKYNLYAVITQIGIDSQNIVASYKSNNDNNWYRYNNENEKPIKNIQKEVIDFEHPLLLFYKKI